MTREEAVAIALASPNREVCGLVIDGVWHHIRNIAKGSDVFIMDMDEVVRVLQANPRNFTGLWHSHPDGDPEPSMADWAHLPTGMTMHIITLPDGEVHSYEG